MMLSDSFTPGTTPVTLQSLKDWGEVRGLKGVQLQAPSTNTGAITYGGHDAQVMELAAGTLSDVLPITHLNDMKVAAFDSDDVLRILVFI